ncbi:MAG: OmpA family protein [Alphaproteobacteria bacterium]
MLNLRYKKETNSWPGFVDLFSNLVIILIFLLIVFVFLWTTTSVFNRTSGAKKISELNQINAEQTAQLEKMKTTEEQTASSLAKAKDTIKEMEISRNNLSLAYEEQLSKLEEQSKIMEQQIASLTEQLQQTQNAQSQIATMEKDMQQTTEEYNNQINVLRSQLNEQSQVQTQISMEEIQKLQSALDAAQAKIAEREAQYIEMSTQLNRALADKVAELQNVAKYQSEFYKAISEILDNNESIKKDGDRFILSSDILFASGKYALSESGKKQIKKLADIINEFESKIPSDINWIIRVDGHTDKKRVIPGTKGYKNNTELSFLRADAVVRELVKNGVSKRRVIPTGFGSTQPISFGNDQESLKQNRRIELQLTNR